MAPSPIITKRLPREASPASLGSPFPNKSRFKQSIMPTAKFSKLKIKDYLELMTSEPAEPLVIAKNRQNKNISTDEFIDEPTNIKGEPSIKTDV